MSESLKALLAVILIGCILASVLVWMDDHPNWKARIGFLLGAAVALLIILWALYRRDKAPDFLRQVAGGYFERTGFCFAIVPTVQQGTCFLNLFFQNRYSKACRAQVVIHPSQGFFLIRRDLDSLVVEIACEGGAFGVTRIPWPVPQKYQGKSTGDLRCAG